MIGSVRCPDRLAIYVGIHAVKSLKATVTSRHYYTFIMNILTNFDLLPLTLNIMSTVMRNVSHPVKNNSSNISKAF
jgi:hypothetical protein